MICPCWHHPWSQWPSCSHSERCSWYWPMFTFTVTNEQPAVPRPQVPSVPFHCGHAPLACPTFCLPLQGGSECPARCSPGAVLWATDVAGAASSEQWAPLSSHLKVVSSPALITDERWVILSWENARMPWSRQSSVGRVESISFKFRIPYTCGLVARGEKEKSQLIIHVFKCNSSF